MITSKFFNRFQLLSICLVLSATAPAFAEPTKPLDFSNDSKLIAQAATNQWRRFNLDHYSSVVVPGDSAVVDGGVEGTYNGVRYIARANILDSQTTQGCAVYNCDTVLGLMSEEVVKQHNLTIEDVKPIKVNSQEYPANGVEFIASNSNTNILLAGRIYLIGNRMYVLMAGTDNNYFDDETSIFLSSLSLF